MHFITRNKQSTFVTALSFFLLLVSTRLVQGGAPEPAAKRLVAGPEIALASLTNDFGNILGGELLKPVFTFTNIGTQDLVIMNVRPGCGCTIAGAWTRLTKPGETGAIPVQLQTAGLSGSVHKVITVTCNDPIKPTVLLNLIGHVRKAIDIHPPIAILNLLPDSPFGAASIRITNCLEQPLLLFSLQSTNSSLEAELRTNVFGQDYQLRISNRVPLPPGPSMAAYTLKTTLTNLPIIQLFAVASVSPTFTVEPSQIELAPAPSDTNQTAYITIFNYSSNAVTLSDPRVDTAGAETSLNEKKTGSIFTATVSFPAGFKLRPGETNLFSVRTSNPLYPLIQVPIVEVSNAIPAAPFLAGTGPSAVAANLPLVFQTRAIDSLKLGEEQLAQIDEIKKEFIQEIGGLGQDPNDHAYLDRWEKARPKVDAQLADIIGRRALVRFDMSGDSSTISQ